MGVTKDEGTLVYKRNFFFGGNGVILIPADRYKAVKNLFDELNKADNHTITLKQKARRVDHGTRQKDSFIDLCRRAFQRNFRLPPRSAVHPTSRPESARAATTELQKADEQIARPRSRGIALRLETSETVSLCPRTLSMERL